MSVPPGALLLVDEEECAENPHHAVPSNRRQAAAVNAASLLSVPPRSLSSAYALARSAWLGLLEGKDKDNREAILIAGRGKVSRWSDNQPCQHWTDATMIHQLAIVSHSHSDNIE